MNNPLVSIISPSYNQAQFIEETILSIKNQEYRNIEHIIVDAGSNDGTLDIIKKYENTYNMKWISEKDDGMYDAISKGLKLAKGEILAYLNTDDLYFDWTVKLVVNKIKNKNYEFVFGDVLTYDNDNKKFIARIYPKYSKSMILNGNFPCQPSVFWTRNLYKMVGDFDKSFTNVGDFDYWIRCAKNTDKIGKICDFIAVDRLYEGIKRNLESDVIIKEKQILFQKHNINNFNRLQILKIYHFFKKIFYRRFYFFLYKIQKFFKSTKNAYYYSERYFSDKSRFKEKNGSLFKSFFLIGYSKKWIFEKKVK